MRAAGVVDAAVQMLRAADEDVAIAAAEAIRHLACANQDNRIRAREVGAIPHLCRMLMSVADATCSEAGAAGTVTAAVAALRNLAFNNEENCDMIRFSGGLAPLLQIVASGNPPKPPAAGTPRRQAAYRAAGALENLAADNEANAHAIVRAGVVPAMKELLIGVGHVKLSQKAARKGREALFALMILDKQHAQERKQALIEKQAAAVEATARAKARVLTELRRAERGEAADSRGDGGASSSSSSLERRVALQLAESELSGLVGSSEWAHAVVTFADSLMVRRSSPSDEGDEQQQQQQQQPCMPPPPPVLDMPDRAVRVAIYHVLRRPLLAGVLAVQDHEDGRGISEVCVVDRT